MEANQISTACFSYCRSVLCRESVEPSLSKAAWRFSNFLQMTVSCFTGLARPEDMKPSTFSLFLMSPELVLVFCSVCSWRLRSDVLSVPPFRRKISPVWTGHYL